MPAEIQQQEQFQRVGAVTRATFKNTLNMSAKPPFVWRMHPRRWQIMGDGDELLPTLGTIKQEPGVNGVDASGDDTLFRVASKKEGWIPLEWHYFKDLGPTGYCSAVQGKNGPVHFSVFETPKQVGNRVYWAQQAEGQKRYHVFLRSLLTRNLIPQPEPEYIAFLIDKKKEEAANFESKDLKIKGFADGLRRTLSHVAALERALERRLKDESVLNPEDFALPEMEA